ncbi:MAG: 3'(2'),5'-bisphosphate nucleotidase CysQ, partial [Candidatus Competibacteraceae bacterium]|nr:3'(2'),5'-bisphosphate nucleotidase CysQ [Candidatus Competibacteraceae bacterium]
MSTSQLAASLIPDIIALAQRAGENIMAIYAEDFSVSDKADQSPLTAADLAAHQTICAGLAELTPDIPVLSEESASVPFHERSQWTRYWLVDPLDGTKEFIKRNGEFTVNIALIENHRAILGVVLIPAR